MFEREDALSAALLYKCFYFFGSIMTASAALQVRRRVLIVFKGGLVGEKEEI
jgi:hypothetical protein